MDFTQEAVSDVAEALHRVTCAGGSCTTVLSGQHLVRARAALEAAAPHVAAAERESIRQLALHKRAVYCLACDGAPCGHDDILRPFADLLTEEPTD